MLYAYIGILFVEVMFLGMALRKAWMHRASQTGSALILELTRDSVFYFSMQVDSISSIRFYQLTENP
jgi:hypothetical protein